MDIVFQKYHSFVFSNCIVLVSVIVDIKPILGMLGMRQEYILNGRLGHHKESRAHIHTFIPHLEQLSLASILSLLACFQDMGETGELGENPHGYRGNVKLYTLLT